MKEDIKLMNKKTREIRIKALNRGYFTQVEKQIIIAFKYYKQTIRRVK